MPVAPSARSSAAAAIPTGWARFATASAAAAEAVSAGNTPSTPLSARSIGLCRLLKQISAKNSARCTPSMTIIRLCSTTLLATPAIRYFPK